MFEILSVETSENNFKTIQVKVPCVSKIKSGQYALITVEEGETPFPLSIADVDETTSSVFFIFEMSNGRLNEMREGDKLFGVRAPLGKAFMPDCNRVLVVCDKNGLASCGFLAKQAKMQGKKVCFVSTSDAPFINRYIKYFDELYTQNDCNIVLPYLFETNDKAIVSGKYPFIEDVVKTCNRANFTAYVFTNSVIVDGMGICGGCRLNVGGKVKYACVDGPCFLASEINFDELKKRDLYEKRNDSCKLFEG